MLAAAAVAASTDFALHANAIAIAIAFAFVPTTNVWRKQFQQCLYGVFLFAISKYELNMTQIFR